METAEVNNKLQRLSDIITEAREIISSLEEFIKDNGIYGRTPVSQLEMPNDSCRTRFLSVCSLIGIKTIQDLIDYGSYKFSRCRKLGTKTINYVTEALRKQYGIEW